MGRSPGTTGEPNTRILCREIDPCFVFFSLRRNFFQACINFIIVGLILFGCVTLYAKLVTLKMRILKEQAPFVPTLVECTACYSMIDQRCKICKFCHHAHDPAT